MKFSALTIHPSIIESFCTEGLLSKAQEKGLLQIQTVNIRDFSDPPHFRVDEKPYGGGPGMVLKCEPIVRALRAVSESTVASKRRVIVLAAKGRKFTQATARRWAKYEHLVFICGRYEGIDERVAEFYADEEVRVGDYVLMGGEVAAALMIEAVGRLIPGVLGNSESIVSESFSMTMKREHEQFTRPAVFEGHEVPEVLLRGNHLAIQKWRSDCRAKKRRP